MMNVVQKDFETIWFKIYDGLILHRSGKKDMWHLGIFYRRSPSGMPPGGWVCPWVLEPTKREGGMLLGADVI